MNGSSALMMLPSVAPDQTVDTSPDRMAVVGVVVGLVFVGVVIAVVLMRKLSSAVHEVEAPYIHEVATHHTVDPVERLHAVHHAQVADCDLRVEQVQGGFRGEASTMMKHEDVWAGPIRGTPEEAVADAVEMIDELRIRPARIDR